MVGPILVDLAREFDIPVGMAGLLTIAMAIPWALGSPFAGFLSDCLGRWGNDPRLRGSKRSAACRARHG